MPTLFDHAGGTAAIHHLEQVFYASVLADPLLQPLFVDHGLTGTRRDRPRLREALAACRAGDTLVVAKLDRLARSLPDARDIGDRAECLQDHLGHRRGAVELREVLGLLDRPEG